MKDPVVGLGTHKILAQRPNSLFGSDFQEFMARTLDWELASDLLIQEEGTHANAHGQGKLRRRH